MSGFYYFVPALGFLLFWERRDALQLLLGRPDLKPVLWDVGHLVWQSLFLAGLDLAIGYGWGEGFQQEWRPLILLPTAFFLGSLGASRLRFVAVYALAMNACLLFQGVELWLTLLAGSVLTGSFFLLMLGVDARLQLAPVPRFLEGLPVSFVTATLLALGFGGLVLLSTSA